MIETIELKNFKSHLSTQLHLDESRLHAIVGQNSSGKTSILQALYYLSQLADKSFGEIFQHERAPRYFVTVGKTHSSVSVSGYWDRFKPWKASYSFSKRWNGDEWDPIASWSINGQSDSVVSGWSDSIQSASFPIGHAVYLKLVSSNLARASYSGEVAPRVEYDGEGLAPTLDYMRDAEPESFVKLQKLLRKVVPGVQEVGVQRAKVKVSRQRSIEVDGKFFPYEQMEEITGQEVVLSMSSGERIPAHVVSEGTLLVLGLLAVILHPQRPSLILLDDIEQGLHPKAQKELISVFKEIIHLNPDLQILFSTHSPYIIDELTPSQVHVLNNTGSDGYTIAKRLDEHPDAKWALQGLTTGEFWDAEGEEWILENSVQNG